MKRATASRDWDRGQVTVRLTTRRKESLMLLAAQEAVSGSPTDAIDRAIDLALDPGTTDALRGELSELRILLAQSEAARERQEARLARELSEISGVVTALTEALRALSIES